MKLSFPSIDLHSLASDSLSYLNEGNTQMIHSSLAKIIQLIALPFAANGAVRIHLFDDIQSIPITALENFLINLSQQMGYVLPQSHALNLISRIQNEEKNYADPSTRGHQTNAKLAFHCDRCDVNILLYVRAADIGGEISVLPFNTVGSVLREVNNQAYKTLFSGFPFDLRDERIFSSIAWHWRPILWFHNNELRGHYIRRFINDSQRHRDCPRLTDEQISAITAFDDVMAELAISHTFRPSPGELLLLNNYKVMHARAEFQDLQREHGGRLALRTWIAPYDSEALPDFLHALTGGCRPGTYRGGVGSGNDYLLKLNSTPDKLELFNQCLT